MGKGEIARYEQFLLFPQCFLLVWKMFCHLHQNWNCRLQTLSVWKNLKIVVKERVKILLTSKELICCRSHLWWLPWTIGIMALLNFAGLMEAPGASLADLLGVSPYLGSSVVSVSDSWPGGSGFETRLRLTFFPTYFRLSPLLKACEKSSRWLWKERSVSTGVRKTGNTYVSPTAMIWP